MKASEAASRRLTEPGRARSRAGWWTGAAALATAAAVAILWIATGHVTHVAHRRVAPPQHAAVALADITASLFSVDGEPARLVPALGGEDRLGAACDEAGALDDADCVDGTGADDVGAPLDLELDRGDAGPGEHRHHRDGGV